MDVARLNFSHGEYATHKAMYDDVRAAAKQVGRPFTIFADLCGPKIRVGKMQGGQVALVKGKTITLSTADLLGTAERVSHTYLPLARDVKPGDPILLDDGLLQLRVESVAGDDVVCRIVDGGVLKDKKGMNLPGSALSVPALTEKDKQDIVFGRELGVDWFALSFVKNAADIEEAKSLSGGIPIIAKIEKPEAVTNLEAILEAADAVMVARGDLGVEVPLDQVPGIQKRIIRMCNMAGKPVITATQMLQSMIENPRPTRAEVTDIANAILDGSDAVMLSGETAIGRYPVRAARMMARVAQQAERLLDFEAIRRERALVVSRTPTDAISESCVAIAHDLQAKAIICSTSSGHTARMVSKNRPRAPIIAVTPQVTTYRRLTLTWGVQPLLVKAGGDTDEVLARAQVAAKKHGLARDGDLVVISAGVPVGVPGRTNLIRVQVIGE